MFLMLAMSYRLDGCRQPLGKRGGETDTDSGHGSNNGLIVQAGS